MFRAIPNTKDKIHFKYFQKGDVWRIFLTPVSIIVGETRDTKNKLMYLFSFDYKNKKKYLVDFQLNEKWWQTICGATKNIILITGYEKPDLPLHKGITAIDIYTGETLWENPEITFGFCNDKYLYCYSYKFNSKLLNKLDINSGELLQRIESENEQQKITNDSNRYQNNLYERCLYPQKYTSSVFNTDDLILVKDILEKNTYKDSIEFIIFQDKLIYNYFPNDVRNLNMFENTIEIIDLLSGKTILKDTIDINLKNPLPDSFFLADRFLIYIQNRNLIKIFNFNL